MVEPSEEFLNRCRQLIGDCEHRIMHEMNAFRGAVFQGLQRWEITQNVCRVSTDHCRLTFPLIQFLAFRNGTATIKFTVPNSEILEARREWRLRLRDGEIWGQILEWSYRHQREAIEFTLQVQVEDFEMTARRGETASYTFTVATAQYRRQAAEYERHRERSASELLSRHFADSSTPQICRSCKWMNGGTYHGQQGSNLLVCAMHPYGNGEDCSDFEGK